MSFDPFSGDLWVGDVGGNGFEEINLVRAGENYGSEDKKRGREGTCGCPPFVDPLVAFGRGDARSITIGHVYQANKNSPFYGALIAVDFETKKLFAVTRTDRKLDRWEAIGTAPAKVSYMPMGVNGEMYALGYDTGILYRFEHSALAGGNSPIVTNLRGRVQDRAGIMRVDLMRGILLFQDEKGTERGLSALGRGSTSSAR